MLNIVLFSQKGTDVSNVGHWLLCNCSISFFSQAIIWPSKQARAPHIKIQPRRKQLPGTLRKSVIFSLGFCMLIFSIAGCPSGARGGCTSHMMYDCRTHS
jgi:hypothetical protein